MSSIVFSPYSNVIKIEHLECYGCRTRAKGRVEVIVQIIQAKTKQNKIKPTTVEGKKKKKSSFRSSNDPVRFPTLFQFISSASIFTFST